MSIIRAEEIASEWVLIAHPTMEGVCGPLCFKIRLTSLIWKDSDGHTGKSKPLTLEGLSNHPWERDVCEMTGSMLTTDDKAF